MMTTTPDITIIGGGVIGMLTARAFNNAGVTVSIIDKSQLGQESSWAGGGILLPLYPWRQADAISYLAAHSLTLYPTLAEQLLSNTGIDPELTRSGMLITDNPDADKALAWCQQYNINHQPAALAQLKQLHRLCIQPLWLPEICHIRNPRLVKALRQDLCNRKIAIEEHTEVTGVRLAGNRISTIKTNHGERSVGEVIIASGAWSGTLLQQLLQDLSINSLAIAPVRGQMLLYDTEPGLLTSMVLAGDSYLIPRRDGKILVGSTVEHVGFDKTTTEQAKTTLNQFALSVFPTLERYPLIKQWAGLRPGTQQGIPYITRHPELTNLSINAGHFRNGLILGPASAKLMTDIVLANTPYINPEPYHITSPH